jgi:hypothetical protein
MILFHLLFRTFRRRVDQPADGRRPVLDYRVEAFRTNTKLKKKLGFEQDPGVGFKALSDHPSQSVPREGVWSPSRDSATADIFITR